MIEVWSALDFIAGVTGLVSVIYIISHPDFGI